MARLMPQPSKQRLSERLSLDLDFAGAKSAPERRRADLADASTFLYRPSPSALSGSRPTERILSMNCGAPGSPTP